MRIVDWLRLVAWRHKRLILRGAADTTTKTQRAQRIHKEHNAAKGMPLVTPSGGVSVIHEQVSVHFVVALDDS
jgi:hypothetical protein